jgi:PmbA protein
MTGDLEQIASDAVKMALARGASDAECTLSEGDEFSASVRMGEIEKLTEAGSRGAGIRVLCGKRAGSSYTSDLSKDGIEQMVKTAIELAQITTDDPFAGLPDAEELGSFGNLGLYDEAVAKLEPEWKIEQAKATEKVALGFDPRIQNSEGASFDSYLGMRVFANSLGFAGSYRTSSCGLAVSPVAKQNGSMERDYWYSSARTAAKLESPEYVGKMAAERALRRLNPRKVATQKVPVIFEPRTARSLVGEVFDAVNGSSIYRGASFLVDKLGEKVASELVTIVDDPILPGLFGSSPFDDEGVRSRRTVVIERGVLKSYLLNSYSARKLKMKTTGNASRGLSGNAGVGPGNLFLQAGRRSAEEIIRGVKNGFYVTELIGTAASAVTGDYSSGAAGLWIEDGELAYAVSEVTIAGNLQQMLADIGEVGSDLDFRGAIASPTILIGEMTISGH